MVCGVGRLVRLAEQGLDCLSWYDDAQRQISEVCRLASWDFVRFTECLAITSPRCSVLRNIRRAFQWLEHRRHLSDTISSIRRSVSHWEETGELSTRPARGIKVKAFCSALLGDRDAITLDTWMAEALWIDQKYFQRKAERELSFHLIRRTAKRIGQSPRDTQAAIWGGIIRDFDQNPARLDLLAEWYRFESLGRVYRNGVIS